MAAQSPKRLTDSRSYRLARSLMIKLRKICRCALVDQYYLGADKRINHHHSHHDDAAALSYDLLQGESYYETAIHYGPWSNALLAISLASLIHFGLILYHQYQLDWNTVRLDYLQFRHNSGTEWQCSTTRVSLHQEMLSLNETICTQRKWLDRVGQARPLMDSTFFGAGASCVLVMCAFIAYIVTQVGFGAYQPFDQYVLRILIDYERELELCRRLISEQVDEFIISHQNSTRFFVVTYADCCQNGSRQWKVAHGAKDSLEQDNFIERELLDMKARNKLMPANRSVEWIQSWIKPHLAFLVLGLVSNCSMMLLAFALGLPFFTGHVGGQASSWFNQGPKGWLVVLESLVFVCPICCPIMLYGSTLTFSLLDQFWLASSLCTSHERFIAKSRRELAPQMAGDKAHADSMGEKQLLHLRRELNRDLLRLLMEFRIFVKQLTKERRIIGCNTLIMVSLFFLVPTLTRLHAPYFDPRLRNIKIFLTIAAALLFIPLSLGLLAPCKTFSRCVRLHRWRIRLLAHLIQVERHQPNFYHAHLTWRLRRETGVNGQLTDQFAISFAGFNFTYSSIIKLYLWFGTLVVSLVFWPNTITSASGAVGGAGGGTTPFNLNNKPQHQFPSMQVNFLDDPFGILKC